MRLTLRDDGYTFKKIMNGKKWVGRVFKHADGHHVGKIGEHEVRAPTEDQAFREVGARAMGFKDAAALAASNSRVRAANRANRQVAHHAAAEMLSGNPDPLLKLLDKACGR